MIINGDCLEKMAELDDDSVDMIFTSPPYANQRKATYGGTPEDEYVEWFLPIGEQIKRIMKPSGSFFLNLKANTQDGERVLYVYELVIALRNITGFKFVDELAWTRLGYPGGFNNRFKNAWEPVYHFTKGDATKIKFNPLACGAPMTADSIKRLSGKQNGLSSNGSGLGGVNLENLKKLELARPSNVIHIPNYSGPSTPEKNEHPATFPTGLVDFFVKSFTDEGDTVLDPFNGSGTTGISATTNNREYIGIEIDPKYVELSERRIYHEYRPKLPTW